jgi:hypothetical protein
LFFIRLVDFIEFVDIVLHLGLTLLLIVAGPEGYYWCGGVTDASLIRTALHTISFPFSLVFSLDWRGSADSERVVLRGIKRRLHRLFLISVASCEVGLE